MIGDLFHLPSRGQPVDFSAATHEMLIRGARRSLEAGPIGSDSVASRHRNTVTAMVKNIAGTAIGPYCPIGLGDCPDSLPDNSFDSIPSLRFDGTLPSPDALWGITQQGIAPGASGLVVIAGPSWLRVQSRSLAQDFAAPANQYMHCIGAASGRFQVLDGVAVAATTRLVAGVLLPSGGAACQRKYTLDIYNGPVGGSFSMAITRTGGATLTKVFDYNWTMAQVETQICTYSSAGKTISASEVEITGGDLPLNRQVIVVPDDVTLSMAGHTLVRQGLAYPSVRLALCCS